jgi:hypothetical protein
MEVSQFTDAASGVRAVGTCRRPRLFSSTCNYLLLVFFPRACVPSANPSACFQSVCAISRACVPSANPSACFPERVCPQQIPARAFQSVCALSKSQRVLSRACVPSPERVCAISKSARAFRACVPSANQRVPLRACASQSVCLSERVPLRACVPSAEHVCPLSRACVSPANPSASPERVVCAPKSCVCVCAHVCVCAPKLSSACASRA